jgi:hypothetical protein
MTITITNELTNYKNDYWLTNNIVDCSDSIIEIYEEKLNNNYKHEIDDTKNELTIRCSEFNRNNKERNITKCYIGRQSNRNKIANNKLSDKQKTDSNNNIYKHIITNNKKRQMQSLPQNCRIYKYEKRKILLDTFSNYNLKNRNLRFIK